MSLEKKRERWNGKGVISVCRRGEGCEKGVAHEMAVSAVGDDGGHRRRGARGCLACGGKGEEE